jgi:hypothetical protein
MCNRFRALCSALLIGQLSQRTVYHTWKAEPAFEIDYEIVRRMRGLSIDAFFQVSTKLPYSSLTPESAVDAVFSEWGPGEYWYPFQCSAISRCNRHHDVRVERTSADAVLACDADTILLETSLALKPSFMKAKEYDAALSAIYAAHFHPVEKYGRMANQSARGRPFVGVHIRRRAKYLKVVPEADIRAEDWLALISRHIGVDEKIYICSDDAPFKAHMIKCLKHRPIMTFGDSLDSDPIKKAFVEFLILSKATRIYGTFQSSFSQEAARFGNRPILMCISGRTPSLAMLGIHKHPSPHQDGCQT